MVRNTIFATNIVAILLLFSSFLSWRVSPLKTNLFSYIGIMFGLIFLVNIIYLFWWVTFKKWKLAFVLYTGNHILSDEYLPREGP
jgi:hypothetical protein